MPSGGRMESESYAEFRRLYTTYKPLTQAILYYVVSTANATLKRDAFPCDNGVVQLEDFKQALEIVAGRGIPMPNDIQYKFELALQCRKLATDLFIRHEKDHGLTMLSDETKAHQRFNKHFEDAYERLCPGCSSANLPRSMDAGDANDQPAPDNMYSPLAAIASLDISALPPSSRTSTQDSEPEQKEYRLEGDTMDRVKQVYCALVDVLSIECAIAAASHSGKLTARGECSWMHNVWFVSALISIADLFARTLSVHDQSTLTVAKLRAMTGSEFFRRVQSDLADDERMRYKGEYYDGWIRDPWTIRKISIVVEKAREPGFINSKYSSSDDEDLATLSAIFMKCLAEVDSDNGADEEYSGAVRRMRQWLLNEDGATEIRLLAHADILRRATLASLAAQQPQQQQQQQSNSRRLCTSPVEFLTEQSTLIGYMLNCSEVREISEIDVDKGRIDIASVLLYIQRGCDRQLKELGAAASPIIDGQRALYIYKDMVEHGIRLANYGSQVVTFLYIYRLLRLAYPTAIPERPQLDTVVKMWDQQLFPRSKKDTQLPAAEDMARCWLSLHQVQVPKTLITSKVRLPDAYNAGNRFKLSTVDAWNFADPHWSQKKFRARSVQLFAAAHPELLDREEIKQVIDLRRVLITTDACRLLGEFADTMAFDSSNSIARLNFTQLFMNAVYLNTGVGKYALGKLPSRLPHTSMKRLRDIRPHHWPTTSSQPCESTAAPPFITHVLLDIVNRNVEARSKNREFVLGDNWVLQRLRELWINSTPSMDMRKVFWETI